jgi:glycosyltransferase involved in cell wall biosynthesis
VSTLRITLLAGPLNVNGPNIATLDLAGALLGRGHRVAVMAGEGPLLPRFTSSGIPATAFELSGRFFVDLPRMGELHAAVTGHRPDIVHVMDERLVRHGTALARLTGCPWVLSMHRLPRAPPPRPGARIRSVIVPGRATRDELVSRRRLPRDLIRVVRPGVDLHRFPEPTPPFATGRTILGTMTRFGPDAGVEDLVDAAKILLDEGREFHLLVAGQGPNDEAIRRRARDLGISPHITVSRTARDFERILMTMDIFVLPSRQDWFSASILMAMAAARPVVACGVGNVFAIVAEGETGYVVPRRSPEILAQRLGDLMDHKKQAVKMGEAGRETVRRNFRIERTAADIETVYREALAGKES